MIVLGIDPSLTATGLAVIDLDDILAPEVHTIASRPGDLPGINGRVQRQARICRQLLDLATVALHQGPPLVVIEQPAYSSRTGHQHDRSGLWWRIVDRLLEHQADVVEVTPTSRARYATGKGNASKDQVLLAVAKRYPHVDVANNNEADALVLAAMGADLAGRPLVDLPATHRTALDKVVVPSGWAA